MPLTIRLDPELEQALDRSARAMGLTRSELARPAIREYCSRRVECGLTPYEKAKDLVGCVEGGPPDLSANPRKYIIEQIERKRRRR